MVKLVLQGGAKAGCSQALLLHVLLCMFYTHVTCLPSGSPYSNMYKTLTDNVAWKTKEYMLNVGGLLLWFQPWRYGANIVNPVQNGCPWTSKMCLNKVRCVTRGCSNGSKAYWGRCFWLKGISDS